MVYYLKIGFIKIKVYGALLKTMPAAINIHHIQKSFRCLQGFPGTHSKKVEALKKLRLEISQGEILTLLGPNGAGKTTLIKILCTLLLPDSGQAEIFGFDLLKEPHRIQPLISLVIGEERSFYWRLTGRQNLEFFAALYNLSSKETKNKICKLTKMFGLEDLDKLYTVYSTGAKHRLALARSFLTDAKIIFMDEPTRSLDPMARIHLRELIRKLKKDHGMTFFVTTHDTVEAELLADRIAILDHGILKACGTLQELQVQIPTTSGSLEEIFRSLTSDLTYVS